MSVISHTSSNNAIISSSITPTIIASDTGPTSDNTTNNTGLLLYTYYLYKSANTKDDIIPM